MMRMSARGFTLLELLVVLAVVGLLIGLVAPNLQQIVGSIERATRRDTLLSDIAGLSYRAYVLGQEFELSQAGTSRLLADGNPVLAVPDGWRVRIEQPIRFGFSGWCSGGSLTLISPDQGAERLQLKAPDCRVERG